MRDFVDAAVLEQPDAVRVVRPYRRDINAVLRAHARCLRRIRRCWVRGDFARWREHAEHLTVITDRMCVVLDALSDRVRSPP